MTGNAKPHSKESTSTKRRARKTAYRAKSKSSSPEPASVTAPLSQASLASVGGSQPVPAAQYVPEHQQLLDALTRAVDIQTRQIAQQPQPQTIAAAPEAPASITQDDDQSIPDEWIPFFYPEDPAESQTSSTDTFVTAPMTVNPSDLTINNVAGEDFSINNLPNPRNSVPPGMSLYELYTDWDGTLPYPVPAPTSDVSNVGLHDINTNNNTNQGIKLAFSIDESLSGYCSDASNYTSDSFASVDSVNYEGDVSNNGVDSIDSSDSFDSFTTASTDTLTPDDSITPTADVPGTHIDPSILNANAVHEYVTAWSTPQSLRTNNVSIAAQKPTAPLDGSPDRLIRRLNEAFREVRADTVMTDEQMLGVGAAWLEAFQYGRAF